MKIFRKLFKLALPLSLVYLGFHAYSTVPTVRMATNDSISTLKRKVSTLTADDINPLKLIIPAPDISNRIPSSKNSNQQPNQQITDSTEESQESSGNQTWSKASANVFINISNNDELKNATRDAMENWNKTGAFTFNETNDRKQANITVEAIQDDTTSAAGVTNTSYNPLTNHLLNAQVKLNTYYLQNSDYNYSYQRVVNTAEHELGHAIGLQHVNNQSVMYPAGSYYSIQQQDINAVRALYKSEYA